MRMSPALYTSEIRHRLGAMNLTILRSRATLDRMTTRLHRLLHLLILTTFALTGVWMRFPGAPTAFQPFYVSGFLIFWPLIASLVLWLLLGAPGLQALCTGFTGPLVGSPPPLLDAGVIAVGWLGLTVMGLGVYEFIGSQSPRCIVGSQYSLCLGAAVCTGHGLRWPLHSLDRRGTDP